MVRLIGKSICSKKVVEDFQDVHFSCVAAEGRIVDSNMNGFSSFPGNMFGIMIFYFDMGDVGSGMIVGHTVLVNCTSDVTTVFLNSILQTSAGLSYVGKVTISFWKGPFLYKTLSTSSND